MRRIFVLDFDEPSPGWMNAWNMQLALQTVCKNTKFEVHEITDQLSTEALEACLEETNQTTLRG